MTEFVVAVATFTGALLLAAALIVAFGGALQAFGWWLQRKVETLLGDRQ